MPARRVAAVIAVAIVPQNPTVCPGHLDRTHTRPWQHKGVFRVPGPVRLVVRLFFYRSFHRVPRVGNPKGEVVAKDYVAKKGDRWYAVIYGGLDPVTGKELRKWHPAGTSREDAEQLAACLARELNGRNDEGRSLTVGEKAEYSFRVRYTFLHTSVPPKNTFSVSR